MGLGRYPDVAISEARELASAARDCIRKGKDPINEREAEKRERSASSQIYTFRYAARLFHASSKAGRSSERHSENWRSVTQTRLAPRSDLRTVGRSSVLVAEVLSWELSGPHGSVCAVAETDAVKTFGL